MNRKHFLLALLSLLTLYVIAQNKSTNKELFCKTWKLVKYKEHDGKVYPTPTEMAKDYLRYNCDGTFESMETGILIKGKWSFDPKTSIITTVQTVNKNYPSKVESTVVKVSESELVVTAKDAEGKRITLYMKSL